MRIPFLIVVHLFSLFIAAQTTLPNFDGVVSTEEWKDAETFEVKYEISPGK